MTHARLTEARRIIAELGKYAPGAYLTDPRPDTAIDSGKEQAFEDALRFLSAPDKASPDDKPVFFLQGDPTNRVSAMRSGALIPVSPKMNKVNGYCTPVFLHPAPAPQTDRCPLELSLGGELAKAATDLLNEMDPDTFPHGIEPLKKALEAWAMGGPAPVAAPKDCRVEPEL